MIIFQYWRFLIMTQTHVVYYTNETQTYNFFYIFHFYK